ncbi:hypothetical protein BDR26DRAFT_917543, partial [Obelidium mucronatum]
MLGPDTSSDVSEASSFKIESWLTDSARRSIEEGGRTTPVAEAIRQFESYLAPQPTFRSQPLVARRQSHQTIASTSSTNSSTHLASSRGTNSPKPTQELLPPPKTLKRRSLSSSILNLILHSSVNASGPTTTTPFPSSIRSISEEPENPSSDSPLLPISTHNTPPPASPVSSVSSCCSTSFSDKPAFFHAPPHEDILIEPFLLPYKESNGHNNSNNNNSNKIDRRISWSRQELFHVSNVNGEIMDHVTELSSRAGSSRPSQNGSNNSSAASDLDMDDEETEDVLVRTKSPTWISQVLETIEGFFLPVPSQDPPPRILVSSAAVSGHGHPLPEQQVLALGHQHQSPPLNSVLTPPIPSAFYRNGIYVAISDPKYHVEFGCILYTVRVSLLRI